MDSGHFEPKTADEFAVLLVKSGLYAEAEAPEMIQRFRELQPPWPDTAASFGDFLVNHSAITGWQCAKLLAGRHKGYFLDDYVLLDKLGHDDEFAYYRARDVRDGSIVKLVNTPMARAKGPNIEYTVER
jgi:hypothetical protein